MVTNRIADHLTDGATDGADTRVKSNKGRGKRQARAFRWIPVHASPIDFAREPADAQGRVPFVVTGDGEVQIDGDPFCRPSVVIGRFAGPAVVSSVRVLLDLAATSCGLPRAGLRPGGALSHRAVFDAAEAQGAEREAAERHWVAFRSQRDV